MWSGPCVLFLISWNEKNVCNIVVNNTLSFISKRISLWWECSITQGPWLESLRTYKPHIALFTLLVAVLQTNNRCLSNIPKLQKLKKFGHPWAKELESNSLPGQCKQRNLGPILHTTTETAKRVLYPSKNITTFNYLNFFNSFVYEQPFSQPLFQKVVAVSVAVCKDLLAQPKSFSMAHWLSSRSCFAFLMVGPQLAWAGFLGCLPRLGHSGEGRRNWFCKQGPGMEYSGWL